MILNKATQSNISANLSAAFFRQLFSGQKAVLQALSVLGVLTFLASPTMADDSIVSDATAGADKAGTCAACHGQDGNSVNPQWPSLAGQNASYLVATLQPGC